MAEIKRTGQTDAVGALDISQGKFREQVQGMADALRQLGGKAEISNSGSVVNDPLSAPFILYVNSYIGNDTFVTGDYATADDDTFAQKVRRISNQRLECGYTESRPFKTINRAVIEAAIITSRSYLTLGAVCGDLVTIVVASGLHEAINGPGLEDTNANFPSWTDGTEPTVAQLQAFNPEGGSGIVLPRGVSIVSLDLRKTRISPCWVPTFANEAADYSNRGSIFNVSGGGYFFGFTFGDKIKSTDSHHLLDCFQFAGKAKLDEFYSKVVKAFGSVAGINPAFCVTRPQESQIVGPVPATGTQTQATDTTAGSSPYIYNTSIRSNLGLCGIFADGGPEVTGFQSMVIAQFTGVSLQKDMRCWQHWDGTNWVNYAQDEYNDYITEQPNNVRMDPERRSIHIRCINRAIIQEVSVFAIGQGIHHAVESGGELTCTNSNSNFGGCASLAEGYVANSFSTDTNWNIARIKVARNLETLQNKWQRIELGVTKDPTAANATTIELEVDLEGDEINAPTSLASKQYSLNNYGGTSYVWIENPNGNNYWAPLANTAWDNTDPGKINVSSAFKTTDGFSAGTDPNGVTPPLGGRKVFIRRLQDVRRLDERETSFICNNTAVNSRNIIRDYGFQTDTASSAINSNITATETVVCADVRILPATEVGVTRVNQITLRRASASANWDSRGAYRTGYHNTNAYYRPGDVCRYRNKHYKCIEEHIAPATFDVTKWDETFVHMEDDFAAEDFFKNTKPVLYFDKDKDNTFADGLLGYVNSDFINDVELRQQFRTSTDYMGAYSFLRSLGFNSNDSHTILAPQPAADRERNPGTALVGSTPGGAANAWDNWAVQMRRPSQIRLFGHAMEWSGFLNYTKALPPYQLDLSPSNKFSYYFTNSNGGRVYISAFNEEGFQITAGGLLDLATGESISPEGLGSDDNSTDVDIFNNVTVNGKLIANDIESDQVALVKIKPGNDDEPSEGRGMSWMAPGRAIAGVSEADGATFDQQNEAGLIKGINQLGAEGFSGPHFTTPAWIELWKATNGLLGRATERIKIYVNPNLKDESDWAGTIPNPALDESYNYNANITTLLSRPPTDPQNAVKTLSLAIQFADLYVSTTTPVDYYIGPGIYWRDSVVNLDFAHNVRIYGWDYTNSQFITDGRGGVTGSGKWLGTTADGRGPSNSGRQALTGSALESEVKDPSKYPCFITRIRYQGRNKNTQSGIYWNPQTFIFRKQGEINGLILWGATTSLEMVQGTSAASNNLIPDQGGDGIGQLYGLSPAEMQTVKTQANRSKRINAYVYQLVANNSSTNNISYLSGSTPFICYDEFRCRDMVVTATGVPFYNIGVNSDQPVFEIRDSGKLRLNGLTLIGANNLDNSGYTNQGTVSTPLFRSESTYKHFGFAPHLISVGAGSSDSVCSVQFCGWGQRIVEAANKSIWNTTFFNIHLMTSDYNYMPDSDTGDRGTPTTVDADQGPGFQSFFGRLALKRRVMRNHYNDFRTSSNADKSGFAGAFGRWQRSWGGNTNGWRYVSLTISNTAYQDDAAGSAGANASTPSASIFEYLVNNTVIRRNGGGNPSITTPTTTAPEIIGDNYFWSESELQVNIKYMKVKVGIDYENNIQANRTLYA